MKKTILSLLTLFSTITAFAQAPDLVNYQAIIRNSTGALVQDTNIGIRASILQTNATGTAVYTETHTASTNTNGLVTIMIGGGTSSDDFAAIDWSTGPYFIKIETDINGGTNYTITGTSQLLSVPYALYAENVNTANGNLSNQLNESKYSNFAYYSSGSNTTYAFNQLTKTWVGQSGGNTTSLTGSDGNFAVYSSGSNITYAFNKNTNAWIGQSGGSTNIVGSDGNFCFYSSGSNTTYAYNKNTNTWTGQSGGSSNIVGSNGNFAFYSSGSNTTYAYNKNTNTWIGQSGGNSTSLTGSNGSFAFYSSGSNTSYAFDKENNVWIGQSGGNTTIVTSESN
ncbi:MAG: hypothetical protein AAF611_10935 [Bacteroidota bacterium]